MPCATNDKLGYLACHDRAMKGECTSANSTVKTTMLDECSLTCCKFVPVTASCSSKTDSDAGCQTWTDYGFCTHGGSTITNEVQTTCPRSCCLKSFAQTTSCAVADFLGDVPDMKCADFVAANYCQGTQYGAFMAENCKSSCCQQRLACQDKSVSDSGVSNTCGYWAALGYCRSDSAFYDHVSQNCPRSCGLCGIGRQATSCGSDTELFYDLCQGWSSDGLCTSSVYGSFMSKRCAGSCCQK